MGGGTLGFGGYGKTRDSGNVTGRETTRNVRFSSLRYTGGTIG